MNEPLERKAKLWFGTLTGLTALGLAYARTTIPIDHIPLGEALAYTSTLFLSLGLASYNSDSSIPEI